MVEAAAVADLAAQALNQPPEPLPPGWIVKASRSQPGYIYYYHQETGESAWEPPVVVVKQEEDEPALANSSTDDLNMNEEEPTENSTDVKTEEPIPKRPVKEEPDVTNKPAKRPRRTTPKEVRVLHILKKHKDSKRPSSWRSPKVTITKDQARAELEGLLEILREESDAAALIATFKELATQESDCSSAKRAGDLGRFGRKKMRPEFEQASFALDINELSDIVETASGLHIILRLE